MKNKLWAIILAAALLLTLSTLAGASPAPVTLTKLYIGSNTPVALPGNGRYTYGGNAGGAGTTSAALPSSGWTWYVYNDRGAYTLTLKGANITTAGVDSTSSTTAGVFANGDLSIRLEGTNTIDVSGVDDSFGMCVYPSGSIRVTGDKGAALTVKGKEYGVYAAGAISVDGCSLNAMNTRMDTTFVGGVYSGEGGFALNNAAVTATGGAYAVMTNRGDVTVDGGSFNATGTLSYGVFVNSGDVIVKGDASVTVDGYQFGIFADGVSMTGGTLVATGVTGSGVTVDKGGVVLKNVVAKAKGYACAIATFNSDISVDGGSLDATGVGNVGAAIYMQSGGVSMRNGARVLAKGQGKARGIRADNGEITVDGATLIARSDEMALSKRPLLLGAYLWKASDRNADPGGAMTASATLPYPYSAAHRYVYITPPAPPKTGDGAPLLLWAALTALSVGGAAWAGVRTRRRRAGR